MAIWAEIKKAINSNISEPLNEFFERKIDNKSSVKSVQRGKIQANVSATGYVTGFMIAIAGSGTYTYSHYIDITISPVSDISKCYVDIAHYNYGDKQFFYPAELVSADTLRIYIYADTDKAIDTYTKTSVGFVWQVIEFE